MTKVVSLHFAGLRPLRLSVPPRGICGRRVSQLFECSVSPGTYSRRMDFSLERARTLQPDIDSEPWLLEIAWLYNRVVETGSQIPVIDLAYELVLPEEFVGECVSYAMDLGFLTAPKRGTFGGVITPKALRKLKQVGKHKQ
jgi:hypothetical protein